MNNIDFIGGRNVVPVNSKVATQVTITTPPPPNAEDEAPQEPTVETFPLPLGSREFASMSRMCGDWYTFLALENRRAFCAVGQTKKEALEACLAQARLAA